MRTLRFLLRKEFLQITRDHVIMRMILIMPLVQLLILANAVTFEVRSARMYVLDQDHSQASRGVVDRLVASGRFDPAGSTPSRREADEAMLRRDADVILVVPEGFEEDLTRTRAAPLQLILNAEDGGAAAVIRSYAGRILESYGAELGPEIMPSSAYVTARTDPPPAPGSSRVEVRRRGWYNAEMDYRDYMVPGILVVLVTMIGTLLTAMNVVREKEAGTLDQLNVTPISRTIFITAKLLPLWTFALVDLALGLAFAHFVLGVPVRGNLGLVFFSAAIYLVLALGIGLWISTLVDTQQQAMFVTFALLMVYLLMSGLFTPVNAMPPWAQWLAELNPVAHFVHLMRAVLLKGAGLVDVARQLAILATGGVVVLGLAVRQYRKRSA
jgi:ABC-2 type transport system permease protein